MSKYLSGDDVADARNAYGCGVSLDCIAGHLGCTVPELRQAMGLPARQVETIGDTVDLWAVERLDAVL